MSSKALLESGEEPTGWDAAYIRGDTPWDYGDAAPELRRLLKCGFFEGEVLVPGCGRGHDVAAIADAGIPVVGLDISPTALREAAEIHGHQTNSDTPLHWEIADLFDLPPTLRRRFSRIWEHTCFTAIPPELREPYVDATADALSRGGRLIGQFFTNAYHEPGETGPPFDTPHTELLQRFSRRFTIIGEWAPVKTYPNREAEELILVMQKRPARHAGR